MESRGDARRHGNARYVFLKEFGKQLPGGHVGEVDAGERASCPHRCLDERRERRWVGTVLGGAPGTADGQLLLATAADQQVNVLEQRDRLEGVIGGSIGQQTPSFLLQSGAFRMCEEKHLSKRNTYNTIRGKVQRNFELVKMSSLAMCSRCSRGSAIGFSQRETVGFIFGLRLQFVREMVLSF